MTRVIARFVGKNDSLGYIKNQVYELAINKNRIQVVSPDPKEWKICDYGFIDAFLTNWKIIENF